MTKAKRTREHAFVGLDRFAYALVARCSCGWSSSTHPSEDRALAAFGCTRWRRSAAGSDVPAL